MIKGRIAAIESTLERARKIPSDRKAELLKLVAELKSEVGKLAETHHDQASRITRFADASTHEAARAEKNTQLEDTALHGLRLSIAGLEASHPKIVAIVGRFATAFSNMGI